VIKNSVREDISAWRTASPSFLREICCLRGRGDLDSGLPFCGKGWSAEVLRLAECLSYVVLDVRCGVLDQDNWDPTLLMQGASQDQL